MNQPRSTQPYMTIYMNWGLPELRWPVLVGVWLWALEPQQIPIWRNLLDSMQTQKIYAYPCFSIQLLRTQKKGRSKEKNFLYWYWISRYILQLGFFFSVFWGCNDQNGAISLVLTWILLSLSPSTTSILRDPFWVHSANIKGGFWQWIN